MLMPKRVKHRKQFRGRMRGKAQRGNTIEFGDYGLVSTEPAWINSRQIESARRTIMRHIKRRGRVWIRIFPDKPITKRAAESRMGKGKGAVDQYVAVVRPGTILFEMSGTEEEVAREALRLAAFKMPVKCKFVKRIDPISGEEVV